MDRESALLELALFVRRAWQSPPDALAALLGKVHAEGCEQAVLTLRHHPEEFGPLRGHHLPVIGSTPRRMLAIKAVGVVIQLLPLAYPR